MHDVSKQEAEIITPEQVEAASAKLAAETGLGGKEPLELTEHEQAELRAVQDAQKAQAIDQEIQQLYARIDALEKERTKTVVELLPFDGNGLMSTVEERRKVRLPYAIKSVEDKIKQLAWSGEQFAYISANTAIFDDQIIDHLKANNFQAKKKGEGIYVWWGPQPGAAPAQNRAEKRKAQS